MINLGSSSLVRRFQPQQHLSSLYSSAIALRFGSGGIDIIGRFKKINLVNTHIEVKNDTLEVNRVSYTGLKELPKNFDLSLPFSHSDTMLQNEETIDITDDFNRESVVELPPHQENSEDQELDYVYSKPVETYSLDNLPEDRKDVFERFRGNLFLNTPDGVKLTKFFNISSETISWNHNTLALLLLIVSELRGNSSPKVPVADFVDSMRMYGIKTANWQGNIKKMFELKSENRSQYLCYSKKFLSSGQLNAEIETRFSKIVVEISDCCKSLEYVLDTIKEGKTETIAHQQVFTALVALSGEDEIPIKDYLDLLDHSGITRSNWTTSLSNKYLSPFISVDVSNGVLSISKTTLLCELLNKYTKLFSQKIASLKKDGKVSIEKKPDFSQKELVPVETSTKTELLDQNSFVKRWYALNGNVSVLETDPKQIIFHLPRSEMRDTMEVRRKIIEVSLAIMMKKNIQKLSYADVRNILTENRLSKIQIPRDLTKNRRFKCDHSSRTVSLSDPKEVEEMLGEIKDSVVRREDISSKMSEIIPLVNEIRKKVKSDEIPKSDLVNLCEERKVHLNIPRDFSKQFGFIFAESIYIAPYPFNQAVELLNQRKKK